MKLATECEINIQCIRKRIERLIRASAAGQNAKCYSVRCRRLVGLYRAHTALCILFWSVVSGNITFACVIELTQKKIKVLNAQINLPKLHTKYQSIHTLSNNSHVDDR